jgi:hypothetical protein
VISPATPERVLAIARAAFTTATAGGALPLSTADRRAITGALWTVFGGDRDLDLDVLTCRKSEVGHQ